MPFLPLYIQLLKFTFWLRTSKLVMFPNTHFLMNLEPIGHPGVCEQPAKGIALVFGRYSLSDSLTQ